MSQHHTSPVSLTLAPCSPTVAKLLHQLQTEMLKETHGLDVVPDGAIVLPTPQGMTCSVRERGDSTELEIENKWGNGESFIKRWTLPEGWRAEYWHPAHWHHHLNRTDAQGRIWTTCGQKHVMDDFGMLVPAGDAA